MVYAQKPRRKKVSIFKNYIWYFPEGYTIIRKSIPIHLFLLEKEAPL